MSDKKPNIPAPEQIDLSLVKNAEAVIKKDKSFQNVVAGKKKISKFDFRGEPELIPLPSKGKLYKAVTQDKDVLSGFIKMYPMTAAEEEILSNQKYAKAGTSTRAILDSCIASNIDAADILLFDSNFLLFYLRKISYGDEYTFEIASPEDQWNRKFEHTVKISELKFEELPDDIKEPIIIHLPKTGYTVETVLPRLFHSEDIHKRNMNRKRSTDDSDKRLTDNIVVTTVRVIDPNGEEVPEMDWEDFYEAIPALDKAEIRDKTTFSTGVDEIKGIVCPYTEREIDISIPIGPEFFRF